MEYSGSKLLSLSYIPEVLSKVSAGSSGYIHLGMILVAALWTFPLAFIVYDYLSVVSAYMAVVRLCVELCILDIIVDIPYNLSKGVKVISHIWNFYI